MIGNKSKILLWKNAVMQNLIKIKIYNNYYYKRIMQNLQKIVHMIIIGAQEKIIMDKISQDKF